MTGWRVQKKLRKKKVGDETRTRSFASLFPWPNNAVTHPGNYAFVFMRLIRDQGEPRVRWYSVLSTNSEEQQRWHGDADGSAKAPPAEQNKGDNHIPGGE